MTKQIDGWQRPMLGRLLDNQAPCAACGTGCPAPAVDEPESATKVVVKLSGDIVERAGGRFIEFDAVWLTFSRCSACLARFEAWSRWATRTESNVRALGGGANAEVAAARAESLACAAALTGFEGTAGPDLLAAAGLMQHPADGPGWTSRFVDYASEHRLEPGVGAGVAFGHITRDVTDALRRIAADAHAFAAGNPPSLSIRDAAHLVRAGHEDDAILAGCFACGADSVPSPRIGATAADVWQPFVQPAASFGSSVHRGRGAGRVVGLVCPSCAPYTEAHMVGGELVESLLAHRYGLRDADVFADGGSLLFAGAMVRARRKGMTEPAAGEAWAHLPAAQYDDDTGALVWPAVSRQYVAPSLPAVDPAHELARALTGIGMTAEEAVQRLRENPQEIATDLTEAAARKVLLTAMQRRQAEGRNEGLTRLT